MEFSSNIKRITLKLSFVVLTCSVLLWFSIFSYGLLYYLYIPAIAHIKPVYLRYDTSCIKPALCKHPRDNVTLVVKTDYELLSRGQIYTIELELEMPESQRNMDQGMFMVRLEMLSKYGEILSSSRRPALLKYRSPLFKVIYTLFYIPALLAGYADEKQSLLISLFEQYAENNYQPAHYAYIEIEAQTAEVYSSSLRIHAQFTGLRYMMYYWPLLSSIIGVGFCFFSLSVILAFIWMRQIMNSPQHINLSNLEPNEQELVNEIRQSVQQIKSQQPLSITKNQRGPIDSNTASLEDFSLGADCFSDTEFVDSIDEIEVMEQYIDVNPVPETKIDKSPYLQKRTKLES